MFAWLFGKDERKIAAQSLYRALVEASRNPDLYQKYGVPDTVDGRFDMLIAHAIIVFKRLRSEGDAGKDFSQLVFDIMFDDMDAALRELGTGDMSVGKRIREMGEAFYGRAAAYDPVIDANDASGFADILHRNLFPSDDGVGGSSDPVPQSVLDLAAYFIQTFKTLESTDAQLIFDGQMTL